MRRALVSQKDQRQVFSRFNTRNLLGVARFFWLKCWYGNRLKTAGLSVIGPFGEVRISRKASMSLGKKVCVSSNVDFEVYGKLAIGSNVDINKFTRIVAFSSIEIGCNVAIARFVSILDHDHAHGFVDGKLAIGRDYICDPVFIGNNVWIGDKVTILKGVNIGDNVIVGAHSVVTKDIESNSIAAGVPCRVIARRPE